MRKDAQRNVNWKCLSTHLLDFVKETYRNKHTHSLSLFLSVTHMHTREMEKVPRKTEYEWESSRYACDEAIRMTRMRTNTFRSTKIRKVSCSNPIHVECMHHISDRHPPSSGTSTNPRQHKHSRETLTLLRSSPALFLARPPCLLLPPSRRRSS